MERRLVWKEGLYGQNASIEEALFLEGLEPATTRLSLKTYFRQRKGTFTGYKWLKNV